MTASLVDRLGIGPTELISIVGAGGKTTLLQAIGCELASDGYRVVLTATTRMAADQVTEPVCWSVVPGDVAAAHVPGTPLFVMSRRSPDKAVGPDPDSVDRLFEHSAADHVVVEADGARTMSIKAPADHEPVIPSRSTLVIVVVSADALGTALLDVAHRPEQIVRLTGATLDSIVTPDLAAAVLLHPEGGLKNIPHSARIVIAITKVSADTDEAAAELQTRLTIHPMVDQVLTLAHRDLAQHRTSRPTGR
jgi:molybdenum cofactor cytidylyltransferase